jgi:hypothetical protein
MAGSALAYDLNAARFQAVPEHQSEPENKPALRAIPGRKPDAAAQTRPHSLLKTSIIMFAIVVLNVSLVSIGRVYLVNLTVEATMAEVETQDAIAEARADGLKLEMQYALLASSTAIQKQANMLGLVPAAIETLPAQDTLTPQAATAINDAIAQQEAARIAAAESLAAQQRAAQAAAAAAQRAAQEAAAASELATTAQPEPDSQTANDSQPATGESYG